MAPMVSNPPGFAGGGLLVVCIPFSRRTNRRQMSPFSVAGNHGRVIRERVFDHLRARHPLRRRHVSQQARPRRLQIRQTGRPEIASDRMPYLVISPSRIFSRSANSMGLSFSFITPMNPTSSETGSGTNSLKVVGGADAVFQSPSPGLIGTVFSTNLTSGENFTREGSWATTAAI